MLTVPSGRTISVAPRTKVRPEMTWMALEEEEEGLNESDLSESDLRERMDLKEGIVDRSRLGWVGWGSLVRLRRMVGRVGSEGWLVEREGR
jgi:hypothetical protein